MVGSVANSAPAVINGQSVTYCPCKVANPAVTGRSESDHRGGHWFVAIGPALLASRRTVAPGARRELLPRSRRARKHDAGSPSRQLQVRTSTRPSPPARAGSGQGTVMPKVHSKPAVPNRIISPQKRR